VIAGVLGDLEHAVQFLLDGLDQPPRLPGPVTEHP
jgi:hypothetical protein